MASTMCCGCAAAAAGDDGHLDGVADGAREREVVAVLVAVGVHAGEQQLAGAQLDDALRPLDGVEAGRRVRPPCV